MNIINRLRERLTHLGRRIPVAMSGEAKSSLASRRRVTGGPSLVIPAEPAPAWSTRSVHAAPKHGPILRVVHSVDASEHGFGSRLRISGRLADVCAELDRLAALEARRDALMQARG